MVVMVVEVDFHRSYEKLSCMLLDTLACSI